MSFINSFMDILKGKKNNNPVVKPSRTYNVEEFDAVLREHYPKLDTNCISDALNQFVDLWGTSRIIEEKDERDSDIFGISVYLEGNTLDYSKHFFSTYEGKLSSDYGVWQPNIIGLPTILYYKDGVLEAAMAILPKKGKRIMLKVENLTAVKEGTVMPYCIPSTLKHGDNSGHVFISGMLTYTLSLDLSITKDEFLEELETLIFQEAIGVFDIPYTGSTFDNLKLGRGFMVFYPLAYTKDQESHMQPNNLLFGNGVYDSEEPNIHAMTWGVNYGLSHWLFSPSISEAELATTEHKKGVPGTDKRDFYYVVKKDNASDLALSRTPFGTLHLISVYSEYSKSGLACPFIRINPYMGDHPLHPVGATDDNGVSLDEKTFNYMVLHLPVDGVMLCPNSFNPFVFIDQPLVANNKIILRKMNMVNCVDVEHVYIINNASILAPMLRIKPIELAPGFVITDLSPSNLSIEGMTIRSGHQCLVDYKPSTVRGYLSTTVITNLSTIGNKICDDLTDNGDCPYCGEELRHVKQQNKELIICDNHYCSGRNSWAIFYPLRDINSWMSNEIEINLPISIDAYKALSHHGCGDIVDFVQLNEKQLSDLNRSLLSLKEKPIVQSYEDLCKLKEMSAWIWSSAVVACLTGMITRELAFDMIEGFARSPIELDIITTYDTDTGYTVDQDCVRYFIKPYIALDDQICFQSSSTGALANRVLLFGEPSQERMDTVIKQITNIVENNVDQVGLLLKIQGYLRDRKNQ